MENNRYKKLLMASAFAATLLLSSCEDFLDLKPTYSLISANAITDAKTANAAVIGAYSQLKSYATGNYIQLGILPGDNVAFGGSQTLNIELDTHAFSVTNSAIVSAYQSNYIIINRTNWILSEVPKITDSKLTQENKNQLLGEAYFIRAFAYFNLGRSWGGVQLQLTPTTDLSSIGSIQRSSQAETYAQVEADLTQAENLLSDDSSTRNRAQKSTARALRARLHLYQEKWGEAESDATLVINNSKYELVYPYSAFFKGPFLTKESVFEITSTTNDRNSYWSLWYPSSVARGGSYEYQPTPELSAKLLDPSISGGRKALIDSTGTGSSKLYYGVLYHTTAATTTVPANTDPSYVIRIAELYLIRAEARIKKANPDIKGAIQDLNAIRKRADVPLLSENETDVQKIILAIENERSVEFAFEGQRWYDLVRTKRAGEVLGVDQNYWLFPIPNTDVLADPGLNGENNPGY